MIVTEHIVASGPLLDRVVVDSTAPFRVLGQCLEEVRVEEEHPIYRHFELIVKVSDLSASPVYFK